MRGSRRLLNIPPPIIRPIQCLLSIRFLLLSLLTLSWNPRNRAWAFTLQMGEFLCLRRPYREIKTKLV